MNLPNLADAVRAAKAAKIGPRACNSNRASALGDPCTRKLVYEQTRWQDKELHDATLQAIFDGGTYLEEKAVADLKEAGFTIIQQQRDVGIPALRITGHLDFVVLVDGEQYPVDAKTMSPYVWSGIETARDFFEHRYPYVRAYPAQVLLYAYMMKAKAACILLVNKVTFAMKDVWLVVDDYRDYIEGLLERAAIINKHIAEGSLPDRIEDVTICERCPFRKICLPDKDFGSGQGTITDPDFIAMLERWEATKAAAVEHAELDEDIKERAKATGHKQLLAGPFDLLVKDRVRREWKVDPNIEKLLGTDVRTPYKQVEIRRADVAQKSGQPR